MKSSSLYSLRLGFLFFHRCPGIRHHFVVNRPPVMTDTSAGHRSKLNWGSEVTLQGSRDPKLDAHLAVGSVCVLRGRAMFFF